MCWYVVLFLVGTWFVTRRKDPCNIRVYPDLSPHKIMSLILVHTHTHVWQLHLLVWTLSTCHCAAFITHSLKSWLPVANGPCPLPYSNTGSLMQYFTQGEHFHYLTHSAPSKSRAAAPATAAVTRIWSHQNHSSFYFALDLRNKWVCATWHDNAHLLQDILNT